MLGKWMESFRLTISPFPCRMCWMLNFMGNFIRLGGVGHLKRKFWYDIFCCLSRVFISISECFAIFCYIALYFLLEVLPSNFSWAKLSMSWFVRSFLFRWHQFLIFVESFASFFLVSGQGFWGFIERFERQEEVLLKMWWKVFQNFLIICD